MNSCIKRDIIFRMEATALVIAFGPTESSLPKVTAITDKSRGMIRRYCHFLLVCAVWASARSVASESPDFATVYELVRTNIAGIKPDQLNQFAIDGLLQRLGGSARWISTAGTPAFAEKSTMGFERIEGKYGYSRLGEIDSTSSQRLATVLSQWRSTNELRGLILDLRFSSGSDFPAAANVADLFFPDGQAIMDWGDGMVRSSTKSNFQTLPVTVLVNRETRGTPEAIAASLKSAGLALIVGGTTAGEGAVYRDFLVSNGNTLRIAVKNVATGSGEVISMEGIVPDILVNIPLQWERSYLADPYTLVTSSTNSSNGTNQVVASVRVRRKLNEAELVRSKQTGTEALPEIRHPSTDLVRIIRDPVLARAVDLLKGLSIINSRTPQ